MDDIHIFEACARAAHEANRAYCIAQGDNSQPSWEEAPEWQRSSCIKGVTGVLVDGNGPEQSHESWLEEKRATGWKFGPVKDPEKKEHPCFIPYDGLPDAQRQKDHIFVTTVRAVGKALGFLQPGATPSIEDRLSALEKDHRNDRRARKTMSFEHFRRHAFPQAPRVASTPADPSTVLDLLSLVCEEKLPLEAIERWTPAELEAAENWACIQHLLAAGNEVDEIPAEPVHVRKLRDASPKQDWTNEVTLSPEPRGTTPNE